MRALSVSVRRSTSAALHARRAGRSVPLVPLLAPWVAVVVVAELLPEAGLVLEQQLEAAHPLGRLPEVEVRDEQPGRAAVLGPRASSPSYSNATQAWPSSRSSSGRLVV